MMIIFIIFCLILIALYWSRANSIEPFMDQTIVPTPHPDALSWDFQSPKSSIKNFNETTTLHQNLNELQPHNSHLVDKHQPLPDWVYPYTYVNRRFDHILINLVHKMEKDFNQNQRLSERKNQEWRHPYQYQTTDWDNIEPRIKEFIIDIMDEINRRFNMDIPIVGYRREKIKYHWINQREVIVVLLVYKKYTIEDIKYFEAIDPNINDHLKFNFERELLLYLDDIDETGNYHLKYLRFPGINYENDDTWDDMTYVKEFDKMFYLAKSKDPFYRMLSNTEARDLYIEKIKKEKEKKKYKCFFSQLQQNKQSKQITDQNSCELVNGLWEKQCEKDDDCPYFKGNQNYPNEFGGCNKKTGYCELPIGVDPLTYRKPTNPQKAYCYNCKNGFLGPDSIGQCCQEQEKPDYMFENDVSQRFTHQEILKENGLNWSKY